MSSVLYEPHERPPYPLAFGLSFQRAMIMGPGLVLIPTIVMRAANQDESYLLWTIFALLMVNGLITIVQTLGLGRFGSGYVLVMGSTSAFIGVCVTALTEGGPSLLASLIVTAAPELRDRKTSFCFAQKRRQIGPQNSTIPRPNYGRILTASRGLSTGKTATNACASTAGFDSWEPRPRILRSGEISAHMRFHHR